MADAKEKYYDVHCKGHSRVIVFPQKTVQCAVVHWQAFRQGVGEGGGFVCGGGEVRLRRYGVNVNVLKKQIFALFHSSN